MSAEPDLLTRDELKEQVEEAGLAVFREVGCTREANGREVPDAGAIASGIFPLVFAARVDALDDRATDALVRGDLTAKFLPDLIGPDDVEWDDAGELGQGVWDWCDRRVWGQTNPNVTGKVQAMVRAKGLTMCRTKVSRNSMLLDAVYVTADLECIKQDFGLPLKTSVRNAANTLAKNMAATIDTHPELATQLAKEVESGMKNATQLAKATLALSAGEPEDQ